MENEIPKEMIEAATKAIWNSAMENPDIDGLPDEDCQTFAEVALKAADVLKLLGQIETYQRFDLRNQEEWHALLAQKDQRIAELEAELANIADAKMENFDDDTEFRYWTQSRARWTLRDNPSRTIIMKAPAGAGGGE